MYSFLAGKFRNSSAINQASGNEIRFRSQYIDLTNNWVCGEYNKRSLMMRTLVKAENCVAMVKFSATGSIEGRTLAIAAYLLL